MYSKLSSKLESETFHLEDIIADEMKQVYASTHNAPIADIFESHSETDLTIRHIVRSLAWLKYGCTYNVIAEAEKKASGRNFGETNIGSSINKYLRSLKHEYPEVSKKIKELYPK